MMNEEKIRYKDIADSIKAFMQTKESAINSLKIMNVQLLSLNQVVSKTA